MLLPTKNGCFRPSSLACRGIAEERDHLGVGLLHGDELRSEILVADVELDARHWRELEPVLQLVDGGVALVTRVLLAPAHDGDPPGAAGEELRIQLAVTGRLGGAAAEGVTCERPGYLRRRGDRHVEHQSLFLHVIDCADGGVAAADRHHGEHLVLLDHLLDRGQRTRGRMAVVLEHHGDLAAVDAARRVDLLGREQHAVASSQSDVSRWPGDRPVRADRDGVARYALLLGQRRQRRHHRDAAKSGQYLSPHDASPAL
jgi:hypothetical protein